MAYRLSEDHPLQPIRVKLAVELMRELGLVEFAGQALLVGPTAYFQLSPRSRLTASWSVQAWGSPGGSTAALDLVNFERHQARLVFGVNF